MTEEEEGGKETKKEEKEEIKAPLGGVLPRRSPCADWKALLESIGFEPVCYPGRIGRRKCLAN